METEALKAGSTKDQKQNKASRLRDAQTELIGKIRISALW